MNVYEEAHNLTRAIKESNEYKEFHRIEDKLNEDPELSKAIEDFNRRQFEIQTKILSGEINQADMMNQMQGMMTMLQGKPIAAEYLEAQARFSMMIKDVYEILSDALGVNPNEFFNK